MSVRFEEANLRLMKTWGLTQLKL